MTLHIEGLPESTLSLADSRGETSRELVLELEPDKVLPLRLYVHADPAGLAASTTRFRMIIDSNDGIQTATEATFEAPEKQP